MSGILRSLIFGGAFVCLFAGCVHTVFPDKVAVVDAVSGGPVSGAKVMPIYASFGGNVYLTDKRGIARIRGFGLSGGVSGYSVEVSADGYENQSISMIGVKTHYLHVSLKPTRKP